MKSLRDVSGPIAIGAMILLMFVSFYLLLPFWKKEPVQPGIDYYQLWGIAKVQREISTGLGSPYRNPQDYQDALWNMSNAAKDWQFQLAVYNRDKIDPTGTPLIYVVMGAIPGRYTQSLHVFQIFTIFCFASSALLLTSWLPWFGRTFFAIAVTLGSAPLVLDLTLGNVNALQLMAYVLITLAMTSNRSKVAEAGLASLLVFVTMFKPNFAVASVLLWMNLFWQGRRDVILLSSLITTFSLLVMPCFAFTKFAWIDWWHYTFPSSLRLAYPIEDGNVSGVLWLSKLCGLTIPQSILLTLFVLWSPVVLAPKTWLDSLKKEPFFCLGVGITASLALSPLVWPAYQTLALAPALWLARKPGIQRILGFTYLIQMSGMIDIQYGSGLPVFVFRITNAFSWLLLWAGFVLDQAEKRGYLSKTEPAVDSA